MLCSLVLTIFLFIFQLSISTPLHAFSYKYTLHTLRVRSSWLDARDASGCDLKNAHVTTDASSPLPPPSEEFVAKHIAIGRGTQNYNCKKDPTDAPVSIGALALLYNASCIASEDPTTLSQLPSAALKLQLPKDKTQTFTSSNLAVSGYHFFPDPKTPVFDLRSAEDDLGSVIPKKNGTAPPPPDSIAGQNNIGDGAVSWLKLVASSGELREVYRVNTAGGNPPKTCLGMPATFSVQYSAELNKTGIGFMDWQVNDFAPKTLSHEAIAIRTTMMTRISMDKMTKFRVRGRDSCQNILKIILFF